MNFFADDRGTCIHAKIAPVDDSGCLESDPLTRASKFAINLDIEVDQPCDAEQGEIAGHMGMLRIDLFDESRDVGNIRVFRDIKKRFASQKVIERGRTDVD